MKAYVVWLRTLGWTTTATTLAMCLYVAHYQPIHEAWIVLK